MIEKYYLNKLNYKEYLIIMKYCNFYELIGDDALIASRIFNYKLSRLSNSFKVGFPLSSLTKVIDKLNNLQVNYLVVDKDNIINIKNFTNNNYLNYTSNLDVYKKNNILVNEIINYLNNNLDKNELYDKLIKIKEVINE